MTYIVSMLNFAFSGLNLEELIAWGVHLLKSCDCTATQWCTMR